VSVAGGDYVQMKTSFTPLMLTRLLQVPLLFTAIMLAACGSTFGY
jgi:hypothetical protein